MATLSLGASASPAVGQSGIAHASPQDRFVVTAPVVVPAARFAVSLPVRDIHEPPRVLAAGHQGERVDVVPIGRIDREEKQLLPEQESDRAVQTSAPSLIPVPLLSFDGLSSQNNANVFGFRKYPPDPNGDVGPDHYLQAVNLLARVYSKTGTALTAPFKISSLFAPLGGTCSTNDNGDPIVLYDPLADRWLLSQLAFDANTYLPPSHQCIAISSTADPTGSWFLYDFVMPGDKLNDYPKFGVWPDGYYMSDNQFLMRTNYFVGAGVFAFDRARMLSGAPDATFIYFDLGTSFGGMLPADIDGTSPPPPGSPNYFAMFQAQEYGAASDAIRLFSFHADFGSPSNSAFYELPESPLPVAQFDPRTPGTRNVIEQPTPATRTAFLDPIQDRLMHRLAYRNFGGARESLAVTHTVNVGPDPSTAAGHQAAIRYYELRRSLPGGVFTVPEQTTFAPDADNRWMGSAAMDSQGNLAVGYSVSSKSTFPSIRYAGRLATDPPNGLFQGETVLLVGTGAQLGTEGRWGDYSALSVDPSDDCTFWYTNEYYTPASQASSNAGWLTRIGTFKFPNCGEQAPQGTVMGTVADPVAGATMSSAIVSFSPGGYAAARTAGGTYSAVVPSGTYTLTASARNRVSQTATGVVVVNGGSTTVDFSLPYPPSTGLLIGRVLNARTGGAFPLAQVTVNPGGSSTPTDEDGSYEMYLGAGTYNICASSPDYVDSTATGVTVAAQAVTTHDFSLEPSVHLLAQLGEPSRSNVKLADLDGDGKDEVIVTTLEANPRLPGPQGGGRIHVLSQSGAELPGWPVALEGSPLVNTAAIGDIDGDGSLDIVVQTFGNMSGPPGSDPERVWAFTSDGDLKPGFPVGIGPTGVWFGTGFFTSFGTPSPALADLDRDGASEIIAVATGLGDPVDRAAVVALRGNGDRLFRTSLPRLAPPGYFFDEWPHVSVPTIGDLLGGASPEIVVGVQGNFSGSQVSPPTTTFFALTAAGEFVPGWPIYLPASITDTLETGVMGDLDRDGFDEFVVTTSRMGSTPSRLYVLDGHGHVMSGFPTDLPGAGDPSYGATVSYPALADVDHDGFLDIVTWENAHISSGSPYYLVATDRLGRLISQTAWPASNNGLFGQGFRQVRLALAENADGRVCAVLPVPQFPPNQANLQLHARCLDGHVVPGFPITLPSLCYESFCQDAMSVSLARDSSSNQVFSVLIDTSGNVRRWELFNSSRPIPWSQFQHDPANTGGELRWHNRVRRGLPGRREAAP